MRTRPKLPACAIGLLVLLLFVGVQPVRRILFGPREPFYGGHRLSYWVDSFGVSHRDPADQQALAAIGTNAVPTLLDWIRCGDVPLVRSRHAASAVLRHIPSALQPKFLVDWADEDTVHRERWLRAFSAAAVFSVLGTNAEPFIPALGAILNPTNGAGCLVAENALLHLGTNGFAAIIDALAANPGWRGILLENSFLFDRLKPVYTRVIPGPPGMKKVYWQPTDNPDSRINSARAAPVLLLCLQDADPSVRGRAARLLSAADPEGVVPALTNFLMQSPPAAARRTVTETLGAFGQRATNCAPYFVTRLRDSDAEIRAEATNALMSVAPEMLVRSQTDN